MGTISVSLPSDGQTADAADYNTPVNTIVTEINGNLDNANIKALAAIDASKLADSSLDAEAKISTDTGWRKVTDAWAYASASTITVPTDATAKYDVGDVVKLTQSATVKYFVVTVVAATLLTVSGLAGVTVANAAISDVYYSKVRTPRGLGLKGGIPHNPYKFRVRRATAANTSAGAFAKVLFEAEDYDTNSNFDNVTNFRFTAPIAGFYQMNANLHVSANPGTYFICALYKNGALYQRGDQINSSAETGVGFSDLVQAAASDYFEIFVFTTNAVALDTAAGQQCYFSGFLVSAT